MEDRRTYESSDYLLRNQNQARALINSMDLTYDGKRIRWTRTFEELQNFVANVLEERGKWSPKVSCSRKFTSSISDLGLTWYYTKQKTLLFQGHNGAKLKQTLIKLCKSSGPIVSPRNDCGSSSPVFKQDNDIEIVSVTENTCTASVSVMDGASCKCPRVTGISCHGCIAKFSECTKGLFYVE